MKTSRTRYATNARRPDPTKCIFRRCTQIMQDLVQLVDVADRQRKVRERNKAFVFRNALSPLEDGLPRKQFSEDTTD